MTDEEKRPDLIVGLTIFQCQGCMHFAKPEDVKIIRMVEEDVLVCKECLEKLKL